MKLAGWSSTALLGVYGASAAAGRAIEEHRRLGPGDAFQARRAEGRRRMVEITPFGVLTVITLCIGAIGVVVLAVLLFIAFVPRRNRGSR